jgi:hypothetical protein
MSVYDQPIDTYADTTPHVRVIADAIKMIDPRDTPLLSLLGLDSARSKFKIRGNGYKIELLEDALDPITSTLNNGTVDLTTTTLSFTVADASIFQVGHVVLVDLEYMVVRTVSVTDNTIAVFSRSYGGTNATHHETAAIEIVGMARLEGADADYGPIVDITAPYNYTGIFQKAVKVTGSMQAIDQYGIADEKEYQAAKALPHLFRLMEKALFHGVRAAGSATTPRSYGGLLTFLSTCSVNAGGAIAKSDVDNLMESIYGQGGNPKVLVCNHAVAQDLKNLLDSSSFVRVAQETGRLGLGPLQKVVTQYGDLEIVMDRWCPVAKAFALDLESVGMYTLRPFGWHDLAKTGDSEKIEVVGEFSFLMSLEQQNGWIYGITS